MLLWSDLVVRLAALADSMASRAWSARQLRGLASVMVRGMVARPARRVSPKRPHARRAGRFPMGPPMSAWLTTPSPNPAETSEMGGQWLYARRWIP